MAVDVLTNNQRRFLALRLLIVATTAALLFWPLRALSDEHRLRDPDIIPLLSGATLALTDIGAKTVVLHHLYPVAQPGEHGKTDVIMPNAYDVERGIWWVEEDQFCVLYRHIVTTRKRCFAVQQDGTATRFVETRYELPGKKVVRPNQPVPTASLSRSTDGPAAYRLLDDEALVALLSGASLYIIMPDAAAENVITFAPVDKPGDHGKMYSHPLKGRTISPGTWWVEDEQFCVFWQFMIGVRKRCFSVARNATELRFIETRYEQPGHRVQRDHRWVPSAQVFRQNRG